MARGIIDCRGEIINIGDRLRTEHGDVIDVCGGLVSEHKLFNAHKCHKVPKETPLTNTGHVVTAPPSADGGEGDGDCIVWGS